MRRVSVITDWPGRLARDDRGRVERIRCLETLARIDAAHADGLFQVHRQPHRVELRVTSGGASQFILDIADDQDRDPVDLWIDFVGDGLEFVDKRVGSIAHWIASVTAVTGRSGPRSAAKRARLSAFDNSEPW